ncbi:MAG: hypothetical protein JXQ73_30875 [Phycisphaerae bacterium]|nr:hypothetical protein [Phycisphaerae bacterium]
MEDLSVALLLYLIGIAVLVLEIFIPSHGILGVTGVGFWIAGIVYAFRFNGTVGYAAILLSVVLLPTGIALAVKYWYYLPVGRRMAPPNPQLTEADYGFHTDELDALVGKTGRSVTPLRPVGSCDFDGKRIQCVTDWGSIEKGAKVEALKVRGRDVVVREVKS